MHFADRLIKIIWETSPICVWIDPVLSKIPWHIIKLAKEECKNNEMEAIILALSEFWFWIIDAMEGLSWICKPQLAFFEMYWSYWFKAYEEICKYANEKWILIIADWKRNDIGSTSEAYANWFLWKVDVFWKKKKLSHIDAITVNPYLWSDCIHPFINVCKEEEKGIFVLVKTSNPSSSEFQDLPVWEEMFCEEVARNVSAWWMWDLWEHYFSSVGAVVWATHPEDARYLRTLMPNQIFLVPWYWAQGGDLEWVRSCFNEDKLWAIVNSSRAINYAYLENNKYKEEDFIEAAREEILKMKKDLEKI